MNKETLSKLKELAQAATPGPWRLSPFSMWVHADHTDETYAVSCCETKSGGMRNASNNSAYIAAANPAVVLELIAKVQTPLHEHNARFAIDGAMWKGHEGVDRPPTEDHWLMPYWKMARELAEFKAAAERTTSPVSQMTESQIDAVWDSLDGLSIIQGESQCNWNRAVRREFARAILAAAAPQAQDNEGEKA